MQTKTESAIRHHAMAEYPRECCGLVIIERGRERYVPCTNEAASSEHFRLPASEYADAETRGEIIAVVHSHPDMPARPSEADKVACEASGLPWIIVRVDGPEPVTQEIVTIEPCGYQAPLVGRSFAHGVLDCYTLIRDWYQRERHITLLDFEREDEWWNKGQDLYMQHFAEAGFTRLPDTAPLQVGDVILMQIRADATNHGAVYIGDGLMLHHLYGRLSTRDVYGGYWREVTRMLLRRLSSSGTCALTVIDEEQLYRS
ncbi:C40 family peptidase [Andreprevotia chitinilytica]|uniref:C40 family peptidase n=1 Tax=Andreprevotia chitinilytica TaxID=396808 RepID=UPI00068A19D0|nr:C40 family peptidase [Andreprevotia chitinilytica]